MAVKGILRVISHRQAKRTSTSDVYFLRYFFCCPDCSVRENRPRLLCLSKHLKTADAFGPRGYRYVEFTLSEARRNVMTRYVRREICERLYDSRGLFIAERFESACIYYGRLFSKVSTT